MIENNGSNDLTIVLVHGAFADAAGWNGVIERLQQRGFKVAAPPNPLRGVSYDAAYIASYFNQIPGPVLAVGHSYGGAVITNASSWAKNVVGLVVVAGFMPDEGETLQQIEQGSKDSVLNSALFPLTYPISENGGTEVELAISSAHFHAAFAADVSLELAATLAAGQRPISQLAFSQPTTNPAWKTLPSWAVIPTGDKAAGTDVLRFMAKRAGATITETKGSHVIMISQPDMVTDVILTAVEHVRAAEPTT
jgi:pimeloyl-ACP methyl ester carboxylesterase